VEGACDWVPFNEVFGGAGRSGAMSYMWCGTLRNDASHRREVWGLGGWL
jgi:hypothetical protein